VQLIAHRVRRLILLHFLLEHLCLHRAADLNDAAVSRLEADGLDAKLLGEIRALHLCNPKLAASPIGIAAKAGPIAHEIRYLLSVGSRDRSVAVLREGHVLAPCTRSREA
jgi:hypothetical protein